MVNSIKGKYQTGGYSTGSYNMGRYAKYDEPVDAKEFIIPLINQYIKKKSEIQNFRLGKKHEEFFAIMKKILDTLKEIDKQQAEILIEKYEQLLKEDKEDKINKKYIIFGVSILILNILAFCFRKQICNKQLYW